MGSKCQVFKDPYLDRANETETLMRRINELTDNIKTKADKENDLRKRKDDLKARKLHDQGMGDLQKDLEEASKEYERMANDLER